MVLNAALLQNRERNQRGDPCPFGGGSCTGTASKVARQQLHPVHTMVRQILSRQMCAVRALVSGNFLRQLAPVKCLAVGFAISSSEFACAGLRKISLRGARPSGCEAGAKARLVFEFAYNRAARDGQSAVRPGNRYAHTQWCRLRQRVVSGSVPKRSSATQPDTAPGTLPHPSRFPASPFCQRTDLHASSQAGGQKAFRPWAFAIPDDGEGITNPLPGGFNHRQRLLAVATAASTALPPSCSASSFPPARQRLRGGYRVMAHHRRAS